MAKLEVEIFDFKLGWQKQIAKRLYRKRIVYAIIDIDKFELPDDIENLNKLKENIRIKILKAKNRLDYQSEKKEKEPNPMPEGFLRTKIEKRLSLLQKQKEEVEKKINQIT